MRTLLGPVNSVLISEVSSSPGGGGGGGLTKNAYNSVLHCL